MPEPAGQSAPTPVGPHDVPQQSVTAGPAATRRPGWLRRATLLGSATALVGVTALSGLGTAIPSVAKGTQVALVTSDLRAELEAVPGQSLPAAGMAVISRVGATLKNSTGDAFAPGAAGEPGAVAGGQAAAQTVTESAACVALPLSTGSYRVSSNYGYRIHPIAGIYSLHTGVDYAAPLGTAIHAVTAGTVVYTGPGRQGRSSELVIIEHEVDGKTFYSWYVHMYPDGVFVTVGQQVGAGEVIAEVGNNGNSTGPHLHFEIHTSDPGIGNAKNPVVRTTSSMVLSTVDPTDTPTHPGTGWSIDPATGWPINPETGVPVDPATLPVAPTEPPPATPGPTPPATPGPTPPATPAPDPTAPATPTPDPTPGVPTPEPTAPVTPTPEPTAPVTPTPTPTPTAPGTPTPTPTAPGTPTPTPTTTAPGTPTPTPTPTAPGTPTPTPSPGATPTPTPAEQETPSAGYTPFPIAAYGTTVDPARFLASLGIAMVDPLECAAP